jgi:hypothetical protein
MAPTQDKKRGMRVARKKRKRLERREARKANQEEIITKKIQEALVTVKEEASRHKELASKYYSQWRKCAKQKREIAHLWDKKRNAVCS